MVMLSLSFIGNGRGCADLPTLYRSVLDYDYFHSEGDS
jgi:hypothetical protein